MGIMPPVPNKQMSIILHPYYYQLF